MSGWNVRCKIVAVCRDKVDGQTLQSFTTKANAGLRPPYEVLLFAEPDEDVHAVLNANSDAGAFDDVQPLKEKEYSGKSIDDFQFTYSELLRASTVGVSFAFSLRIAKSTPASASRRLGFAALSTTCPPPSPGLDDLKAVCSGAESARRMRNQAAMCGGVWNPSILAKLRAAEASNPHVLRAHLDLVAFPPFVGQIRREADPANRRGRPILTPLFITAENEQGQRADRKVDRYASVSNLEPDSDFSTEGPAVPPLQAFPELPRELMYASPEACVAFARSRFPGQKQLIQWNQIVVVDELTESERTVILGAHVPNHGLVLNRAAFDRAWNIKAVVEVSGQSHDMRADVTSRIEDGADRGIC